MPEDNVKLLRNLYETLLRNTKRENKVSQYQIVEKDSYATDWTLVRYNARAMARFETEAEALKIARDYLTEINCDNALTAGEKEDSAEAFMIDEKGAFLGILDKKEWYATDRRTKQIITDPKHFQIQGKAEVKVRPIPGT